VQRRGTAPVIGILMCLYVYYAFYLYLSFVYLPFVPIYILFQSSLFQSSLFQSSLFQSSFDDPCAVSLWGGAAEDPVKKYWVGGACTSYIMTLVRFPPVGGRLERSLAVVLAAGMRPGWRYRSIVPVGR